MMNMRMKDKDKLKGAYVYKRSRCFGIDVLLVVNVISVYH
jgi:hypothetical protein